MTQSGKILVSAGVTIMVIAIIYKIQKHKNAKHKVNKKDLKEGFASCANYEKHKGRFTKPTKNNPLMNVLLPEINDNPKRKPAAPSFNRTVEKKIFTSRRIQNLDDFYIIHRGKIRAINPGSILDHPKNILKPFEYCANHSIEISDEVVNEVKKIKFHKFSIENKKASIHSFLNCFLVQ